MKKNNFRIILAREKLKEYCFVLFLIIGNMKKKICIIGAGIGGLSAGVYLSNNGFDVTVFEKENIAGGRALSLNGDELDIEEYRRILSKFNMAIAFSHPSLEDIFNKKMLKGYTIDLGFHSIEGGTLSDVGRVVLEAGSNPKMIGSKLGLITDNGYTFPLVTLKDKISFLPQILRLILSSESTIKKLDNVSIADTIKKYGKGKMKLILELLPRVTTTVNDLSRVSTGESFRASQSNLKRGSTPVGYPIGGLGTINRILMNKIVKNKSKVVLGSKVKKIFIENSKASGVQVNGERFNFDVIVSDILVQNLFDIVDEKHFPKEYVTYLKSLEGTGSLCAYYSLKKIPQDLLGKSFLFIERYTGLTGDDVVGMIEFVTSVPESKLAPPGGFLVQSYIICTPNEARSKEKLMLLRDILDKNLKRLIPDYQDYLNWVLYPTIWHLDGVAKTIDNDKPDIKTPVDNLFLIGDCVKAPGIGVNCAVKSAQILSNILLNQ